MRKEIYPGNEFDEVEQVAFTTDEVEEMLGIDKWTILWYVSALQLKPTRAANGKGRGYRFHDEHIEILRKVRDLVKIGFTVKSAGQQLANADKILNAIK